MVAPPCAPFAERVTVTFRAWWWWWWLKGGEKRGGMGVLGLEGVVWETMLSFLSCHMPPEDILGIDKDLNVSCGRYSV